MAQVAINDNKITQGVIWKQLLAFFFPILIGAFFQQLYNTVDAVVVGRHIGKEALAAVGGSTGTLINLFVGFFIGLSSGATVIISQLFGGKQEEGTSRAVHTAVVMAVAGGLLITAAGLLLAPFGLRAISTPPEVMSGALTYIRIYFGGMVFSLLYNVGSGILRAVGDSRRPLYILIVCCFINVALDLLFAVGFELGVAGVAIATVLSQAVSAVLVMAVLMRSRGCYRFSFGKLCFDAALLRRIVRIGLPAGLQSVLYSVSNILIQSSINDFGTDVIAAWTAYGKIDAVFWMTIAAFGTAITTFSGQNFGAGEYARVRKSVKVCLLMSSALTLFVSAVLLLVGRRALALFTTDAAVLDIGVDMIRLLVPFYITYVCIEVLAGALRGAGDALIPTLITCFGICVLRVLWLFIAVPLRPTVATVELSYPITWIVTSAVFAVYYYRGNWMTRSLRRARLGR